MRIALTGGIACGKSAASAIFASLGFSVISTDALAHQVLAAPETAPALREAFGAEIFAPDGTPSRPALAAHVFASAAARARLEAILHPEVHRRWLAACDAAPDRRWLIEIPLLFEKNLETRFDFSVCVHCTLPVQLKRMATRGLTAAQSHARIAAQLPLDEKIRRADCCLFNEGSLAFLELQARRLANQTHR
jgi:dephospho-CoA kinase